MVLDDKIEKLKEHLKGKIMVLKVKVNNVTYKFLVFSELDEKIEALFVHLDYQSLLSFLKNSNFPTLPEFFKNIRTIRKKLGDSFYRIYPIYKRLAFGRLPYNKYKKVQTYNREKRL